MMIRSLYFKIIDLLIKTRFRITLSENFSYGRKAFFKDRLIINVCKGSKLTIGENTKINSYRNSYHLNMFSPCKIMMDKRGAEITIGNNTRIHGTCIHAQYSITIGNNCLIAANTQIMDCNGHNLSMENIENRINTSGEIRPVIIEDSVWIGTGVVILPGVKVGRGCVITANSVVTKDIPSMCLAGGNPAVVIKKF